MAHTDPELCALLKEGNQQAFLEIYDRYKVDLQQFAYSKVGKVEEVEDILQELFVHLWENKEKIQVHTNLSGYLFIALRNRILNYYVRQRRHSELLSSFAKEYDQWMDDVDHKLREHELSEVIQYEIDHLPQKMREVFLMNRRDELTYHEIADKTDTSFHTVATQMKKALKKLRFRLRTYRFF